MLILKGGRATKRETNQLTIDFSSTYILNSIDSFNRPPETGLNYILLCSLFLGLS